MCGIAGIISFNEQDALSIAELKAMTNAIRHRGPDGEGQWLNPSKQIALGHRRLSIIDLSDSGSQPMHAKENRFSITFNGEIYNYLELRSDLELKGHQFSSETDTEVLLAMFDEHGKDCLNFLDGMFAFAIWDEKNKELFCARDICGEKPFFYALDGNRLVFASEMKAILEVCPKLALSNKKLQNYLDDGQINSHDDTFFEGISVLSPAHYLEIDLNGKLKQKKYWEVNIDQSLSKLSEEEQVEQFKSLFLESIERRMRMDVDYGTSLSGGLDSSAIASVISGNFKKELKTFSARFEGFELDEGDWIQKVIDKHGVKNETVYPDFQELLNKLKTLSYHSEYPLAGSSMFAQWKVMELVHDNDIKVLIDGQGADEYLCGYNDLRYFAIWDLAYQFKWKRFFEEKKKFEELSPNQLKLGWGFVFYPLLKLIGKPPKEFAFGSSLKERLKFALENHLGNLLLSADRNSMAHSVEIRLPFISKELINFVFSLPNDALYFHGTTKRILRQSMKEIVPEAILERKDKIGFAPPQGSWMESEKGKEVLLAARNNLKKQGYNLERANDWRIIATDSLISAFNPQK